MRYRFPDARLIIFTRAPVPGRCKTRLATEIGDHAAAALQEALTRKQLAMAVTAALCPVELWCAPDTRHPFFAEMASRYPVELHPQQGSGLGERMYHALAANPARAHVIIGCDCPQMTADYLARALQHLADGREAVIGPAEDGGYVLLGLRRIEQRLFHHIDWGEAAVLQQTCHAMAQCAMDYTRLETLWDLDHPADYRRYLALPQSANI